MPLVPVRRNAARAAARLRALLLGLVVLPLAIHEGALAANPAPAPLLAQGQPAVDWWFVFKFNSSKGFAGCVPPQKEERTEADVGDRQCPFGGKVQTKAGFGQQFAFASSGAPTLVRGHGCAGATMDDPIGATFEQVYKGDFNYLIWNDQFYNDPAVKACKADSCGAPWGHSKGLLAWNNDGAGFVMQVSTPAWPRSGSENFKDRKHDKGNTLGCNASNNNLRASQHFFALKLTPENLIKVLDGLKNASVVTDPTQPQIVRNGGPPDVRKRVDALGKKADSKQEQIMVAPLTDKITLISKPSGLHVPPWQMVSSLLNSAEGKDQSNAAERAATWWTKPWIPTTLKTTTVDCWDDEWAKDPDNHGKTRLPTKEPGPVSIAQTGVWEKQEINLIAPSNHAKIGTALVGTELAKMKKYAIFGDLNQQGGLIPPGCRASQNARGGLFFAVNDDALYDSVADLIDGKTAPTKLLAK